MGILTGTRHGDAANELMRFYEYKAHELEQSGQYFMAAIALAFALETAPLRLICWSSLGKKMGASSKYLTP